MDVLLTGHRAKGDCLIAINNESGIGSIHKKNPPRWWGKENMCIIMAHEYYNKKEKQMAIKWITKQSNKKADVTIKQGNSKGKSRANITFRNDVWKKITDTGYLKIGVDGNRVYFVQGLTSNDYKVTIKGDCRNGYVQPYTDLLKGFEGDYTLKRDAKTNLRYIQK